MSAPDPPYPCDGCGEPGSEVRLWLRAPLGMTAVWVHRVRACAEAARERRGGGRFFEPGPTREERAKAGNSVPPS